MKKYQVCTNCVMDTSDSSILFDEAGVCDNCRSFYEVIEPVWTPGKPGKEYLEREFKKIKQDGKNRDFDCIIGLSGGLDSSYLLHKVVTEFGVRPLVFHVDAGWNTEIAVNKRS